MRSLVTGGAGFIGSALVRHHVLELGDEVLNVDKLTYAGNLNSLRAIEGRKNHQFLRADIADEATIGEAIETFRPDRIFHLAAESHVDRSISDADNFLRTNVTGTFVLLEATRRYWAGLAAKARESFRFLHVSTDEVFGELGPGGSFNERSRYDPRSPYSATKAASDHLARAWFHTYDLPVITVNSSNTYGPYQFPEKLIPLTILNGFAGRRLRVYGSGENVRDWIHVEDNVRAFDAISSRGQVGETYTIGARNERRNVDIVRQICAILDELNASSSPHANLIEFVEDRPGHDGRYAIDPSRLESELGWQPLHRFEDGLAATVRWYLDNEWWWGPLRERYDGSRLGLLPVAGGAE